MTHIAQNLDRITAQAGEQATLVAVSKGHEAGHIEQALIAGHRHYGENRIQEAYHKWPELKQQLQQVIKQKTQQEWCDIMEGTDVCFAPVLSLKDAPNHPHMKARNTYMTLDGIEQPAPSPRFSRTQPIQETPGVLAGANSREVCTAFGFSDAEIEQLINSKAISQI